MLDLALPASASASNFQVPKVIRIGLVTSDINNCYWLLPDNVYATIVTSSHFYEFLVPTANDTIKVTVGTKLTRDQVNDLLPLCSKATVLVEYSGNNPEYDTNLQCHMGDWNASNIVSKLHKEGKVKVRYTDHEFRDDGRNLVWVEGYELPGGYEYPVDGLDFNDDLGKHLLSMISNVA
jgi:hypothetical protein